jgi:hypothetical protein
MSAARAVLALLITEFNTIALALLRTPAHATDKPDNTQKNSWNKISLGPQIKRYRNDNIDSHHIAKQQQQITWQYMTYTERVLPTMKS